MCMFGVHHSILFVCVYIAIYLSRERDCSILSCAKIIYKYVCFNLISVLLFEQIDVHITPGAHASEEAGNGSVHSSIIVSYIQTDHSILQWRFSFLFICT